ncbi:MAG: hypothetical protein AVDCRST_MAG12-280, partial [uncultured Rubrobacteraceae bacterium]
GRTQAGRQRGGRCARGGLLVRGDDRGVRLPGLRKGWQARGGDGLRGEGARHGPPLPGVRQRPDTARPGPRPLPRRPRRNELPRDRV